MSKYSHWKSFEREITRRMKALGFDAKRNWSDQFSAHDPVDVFAPPYMIQCKAGKAPNLVKAWDEASQNKNGIPIGIARWKGAKKTLVAMDLATFERLVGE